MRPKKVKCEKCGCECEVHEDIGHKMDCPKCGSNINIRRTWY